MDQFDVPTLDRDIARAHAATRAWRRLLRADVEQAAQENPFREVRYVSTRSTLLALREQDIPEPLRSALRRWVHRHALTRIAGPAIVAVARARAARSIRMESPEPRIQSPRELVRELLTEKVPARRALFLESLASGAGSVGSAERHLREIEIEISARLGVVDPSSLSLPRPANELVSLAEDLLAGTFDLYTAMLQGEEDLASLLGRLLGRDVPGDWPAHLTARWLFEIFRGTPLLEGIEPDLGPLPPPLGAASFVRALGRFGAAYARAAASGAPFALAQDPTETTPLRRGALFGSLIGDPVFLARKLGLSRDASRDAARKLVFARLAGVRLEAVRTLLQVGPQVSEREHAERMSSVLSVPVPPSLSGTLPRVCSSSPARLAGALLASVDRDELIERYDEDWFRNPRALGWLRETDATVAPREITVDALRAAAKRWARSVEELAG